MNGIIKLKNKLENPQKEYKKKKSIGVFCCIKSDLYHLYTCIYILNLLKI